MMCGDHWELRRPEPQSSEPADPWPEDEGCTVEPIVLPFPIKSVCQLEMSLKQSQPLVPTAVFL